MMDGSNLDDEQDAESMDSGGAPRRQQSQPSVASLLAQMPLPSQMDLLGRLPATSTTQYSSELLAMLQQEQVRRSLQLSNSLLHSLIQSRDYSYPSWTAPSSLAPISNMPIMPPQHALSLMAAFPPQLPQQLPIQLAAPFHAQQNPVVSLHGALSPPAIPPSGASILSNNGAWPPMETQLHSQWQQQQRLTGSNNRRVELRQSETSDSKAKRPVQARETTERLTATKATKEHRTWQKGGSKQTTLACSASKKRKVDHSPVNIASSIERPSGQDDQGSIHVRCIQRRQYRTETFPNKLWRMVQTAKTDGQQHLISFTEDGTAVKMPFPQELTEVVFPQYFRHKNFASFQRQLSMYGFLRMVEGVNKGAYAHPLFLDGHPELVQQIKRIAEFEIIEEHARED